MYMLRVCSIKQVIVISSATVYTLQSCSVLPDSLNAEWLELFSLTALGIKQNKNSLGNGRVHKDE